MSEVKKIFVGSFFLFKLRDLFVVFSSLSDGGSQLSQDVFGGFPGDTGIRDGDTVL